MFRVSSYGGNIARCYIAVHDACSSPPSWVVDTDGDRYFLCNYHLERMAADKLRPRYEQEDFGQRLRIALGREEPAHAS